MARNNPYAATFDKLYGLLLQLSVSGQHIQDIMFRMTNKGQSFLPQAWERILSFFQQGAVFSLSGSGLRRMLLIHRELLP
ncbi:hypothetical protein [Paenibacillus sp. 32352]|uniref:hypothetical protein n=1 Tax=Paenibacillus sp. 32352 TaxID=1969111 RepID=UPI0009ACCBC0|nr:hypothetical protein [Paenibacillus sp. 32352]